MVSYQADRDRKEQTMVVRIRLDEVLTADLLVKHADHIHDFLRLEGITPHADGLAATTLTERQLKELLEELAGE
jgi:hypothetical protein